MQFEIRDQFYLDKKPFKIISGSVHYFRVVPEYWEDRLIKLKALGCNTVETYVPWNLHEPTEGVFCFDAHLDLIRFLQIAQDLGLYAIVRPAPYICAEWEFGGLPAWLLTKENMKLRSSEGPFLSCVERYYQRLLAMLAPMQIQRGGNIILMQVENEYGAYGDDQAYLSSLRDMMRTHGISVPLVTSDGPWNDYLAAGSVAGTLPTANFGSKANAQFDILQHHVGNAPLMCMEFWIGWFDHWGCGTHHTTSAAESAQVLREILERGSVNIYMFEGGTNFGFTNGANYYDALTPDVTSYDYDALLTEDGWITEKYTEFQRVIAEFSPIPDVQLPVQPKRIGYGRLEPKGFAALLENVQSIATPIKSLHPLSMEALGESFGYVLYRTQFATEKKIDKFRLWKTNDRAQVFLENQLMMTLHDRELLVEHEVDWRCAENATMDILVENMGRVNYGVMMCEQRKGIAGDVLFNGHFHTGWMQYALPMNPDSISKLSFGDDPPSEKPGFFRFVFDVQDIGDTFLDLSGWGKGCAFLNGFNLGRFWEIGPQKRLYIPAPLLKTGQNELILFETEGKRGEWITLCDLPDLG